MKTDQAFEQRAHWLGYLGILPFMLTGLLLVDLPAYERPGANFSAASILFAVQAYGAIILTFVGAVHWGLAMHQQNKQLLTISVLPSLIGWISLLLLPVYGLLLLIIAFILLLMFDLEQYPDHSWFRQLRVRLTSAVCAILLFSWYTI